MSSTELSANVVYEVRQSMANPNNIDVIVKSFTISDGLAQLISGTNENANDDLKLRVFCKALREVIDMVNGWKFLDARPNADGFTIQRKTPENTTDVMILAYDSSNIHVWLRQFTRITTLTSNGLRYRRRGRVIMAIGIAICLLVSFIYGLSLSTAISPPIIGGFAYLFYYRPYHNLIEQACGAFSQYQHELEGLCQQHPDWNVADA